MGNKKKTQSATKMNELFDLSEQNHEQFSNKDWSESDVLPHSLLHNLSRCINRALVFAHNTTLSKKCVNVSNGIMPALQSVLLSENRAI